MSEEILIDEDGNEVHNFTIYRPTTIRDIYNIIGYKVGFVLGSELYIHLKYMVNPQEYIEKDVNPIDEFMECGVVVILLNDTEDIGHWVCVTTNGEQRCYFDPYGELPPDWLMPWVTNYMNRSIQAATTTACGYHCGLFIRSFWMSEDSYRKQFDPIKSPRARDEFVVRVCNHIMLCNGYDYHS
jgi:hypothetical protein